MNCNYIPTTNVAQIRFHRTSHFGQWTGVSRTLYRTCRQSLPVCIFHNKFGPTPLFIPSSQYIISNIWTPPALNIWTPMHIINYMYSSDSEGSEAGFWVQMISRVSFQGL